ncbi:hypothetical protein LEP1GSC161_0350 [Leptospira santarosai str. CBC1416]|uniref:Uncharacterized protein n=1 Tax=Leptospira santarosai str. CBC1416 TaxID=1193059 RepID=M6VVD8_9LEPT|nr:hypothetical protein LEP1GSC161_0350 [Leptospira santarosai str. CBC1416]
MKATVPKSKNSYHTALIFKTQFNLLSSLEKKSIPKSTRYDWKNRDLDSIIGYDSDDPTFKNLDLYKKALESETLKKPSKLFFPFIFFTIL